MSPKNISRLASLTLVSYHQLRVPHQKYTDETLSTVAVKGHAHSFNLHWYKKVNGVWKFAGLNPDIRWFEYDFDKVFAAGRDAHGEKEKEAETAAQASGASTSSKIPLDFSKIDDPLVEQANAAMAIATGIPPKA